MRGVRAWIYLVRLTARRQCASRKTWLAIALLFLVAALEALRGWRLPWAPDDFARELLLGLFGSFFLPIVTLAYGTGALGDEREEKSLLYVLIRPLPKWSVYLAKLAAATPLASVFTIGGLWAICRLGRPFGEEALPELFGAFWPGVLLATAAYLVLFQLVAAAFKHSTLISLAYVFFIELAVGHMPGILKRISIQFYFQSLVYERSASLGVVPSREEMKLFLPVDGDTATLILAALAVSLGLLGAVLFSRKEYSEAA